MLIARVAGSSVFSALLFVVGCSSSTDRAPAPEGLGSGGSTGGGGKAGSAGASGGGAGNAGASGKAGTSGKAGASGMSGAAGTAGASGLGGSAGAAGASGAAGESGNAGSSGSAGAAGTAGSAGTAGTAGASGSGSGGAGGTTADPPQCGSSSTWGAGVLEPISTGMDDMLGGVTPDELTLVWLTGQDGAATIYYVDRATTSSPWSAPATLPGGPYALDRVATPASGLRLGVLKADRRSFVEFTRADRAAPFVASGDGVYKTVNDALAAGAIFADPVVGRKGLTFFYTMVDSGGTSSLFESAQFDLKAPWPAGSSVATPELLPVGAQRRHPTGLSEDGRSLFFWDDVTSKTRVATRSTSAAGDFTDFSDVGEQRAVQPAGFCKRIYYSGKGGSSLDIFHADAP